MFDAVLGKNGKLTVKWEKSELDKEVAKGYVEETIFRSDEKVNGEILEVTVCDSCNKFICDTYTTKSKFTYFEEEHKYCMNESCENSYKNQNY